MKDYRPEVERACRSIGCTPGPRIDDRSCMWHSPRTGAFPMEDVIYSYMAAVETLRLAGHAPVLKR